MQLKKITEKLLDKIDDFINIFGKWIVGISSVLLIGWFVWKNWSKITTFTISLFKLVGILFSFIFSIFTWLISMISFKGTNCWKETNYLSNITPQKSDLNQGLWKELEAKVRKLAETETVYVLTGPVYEREMPKLPESDEPHKIPSGYWKIITVVNDSSEDTINSVGFFFDQNTPRQDNLSNYYTTIELIEDNTGLDFFSDLPNEVETIIESKINTVFANELIN